jgi:hypothetical protein
VRALSRQDWEEAAACVRHREEDSWSPEALAAALAPFVEAHGGVAFDHRARLGTATTITATGRHTYTLRQVLLPRHVDAPADTWGFEDPEDAGQEEASWTLEARIDLRDDTNPEGPLLEIVALG